MYYRKSNNSFNRRGFSHGHRQGQGQRRPRFQSKGIDASLFVRKAAVIQPTQIQVEQPIKFADLPLMPPIQNAIARRNYEKPTPIQAKSIPYIVEGRDVIGIANTGTGKTGAFVLPIVQKMLRNPSERALILVPTRELGIQIKDEIFKFTYGLNIYSALCIGGASISQQIYSIKRNPHFLIATPGRLKDLVQRRAVDLSKMKTVVLDEADRMVDMGFIHDITYILSLLPQPRQSLFFSATLPDAVTTIIQRFLVNPVTVSVRVQHTAANIDQDIVRITDGSNKIDILEGLLKKEGFEKVIVFGRTKHGVEKLSRQLNFRGLKTVSIHGDKPQRQREQAITMFRRQVVNVLVATDVAARGIDIPDVTHVINFDQPATYEDYVHRIGRTGRGDRKGTALTFV